MNDHRIRTALSLVHSDEFKPRDPEEAPGWLKWICAGMIVGIWIVTFVAIARIP